jgi:Suppressor of fused protein (SUFU)
MTDQFSYSESGAPIIRYESQQHGFKVVDSDEMAIEAINQHIEQYIGSPETVFHELISELVHIDVHVVNPTPERDYFTLITSGMSDLPMTNPEKYENAHYAEMVICLPPTWDLSTEGLKDESNYWPIRWLKTLARFPHEYKTWLHYLHTVPNGDPAMPYSENTELCCALLLWPILFDDGFKKLNIRENKTINFIAFVPLYQEEVDFKLKYGFNLFLDQLDATDITITELLDIDRENIFKENS